MAEDARYTGDALVVLWDATGSTYTLTGDVSSFTVGWDIQAADLTAAGDGGMEEKVTLEQGVAELTTFHLGTAGTAVWSVLTTGATGTITYGPQGTAAGLPKGQFEAYVETKPVEIPFNEGVTRIVSFRSIGTILAAPDSDTFAAPAGPLILDQFTDPDSTALTAHTIAPTNTPATSWAGAKVFTTAAAPTAIITSNQGHATTLHTGAVLDAGVADCTLTCDWTPVVGQNNRGRLIFRYSSNGNMWFAYMNEPGGNFELYEVVSDTPTLRGTVSYTFVDGTTYAIKVTLSGNNIELFVDNVSQITYTSATFNTATKYGLAINSGHSGYFDNFTVTA